VAATDAKEENDDFERFLPIGACVGSFTGVWLALECESVPIAIMLAGFLGGLAVNMSVAAVSSISSTFLVIVHFSCT